MLSAMNFNRGHRRPAERLRSAVDALPRHSREAMLRGLDAGPIIAGAYSDSNTGGICPMLAAHRNGGRTDLASFARSWDCYTGARKARLATKREIRTLRSYLELSLIDPAVGSESMVQAASRIRSERSEHRASGIVADTIEASRERGSAPAERKPTGERDRSSELAGREFWSWIRPTRRYDTWRRRVAAASGQHSEQAAATLLDRTEAVERESAGV